MIELRQFLLWILRRIVSAVLAAPRRWHDQLTDMYEYRDWFIPVLLICLVFGGVGFAFGIGLAALGQSHLGATVMLSIWGGGILFVLSTGIRAMWRAFKEEQQKFIDTLKQ